MNSIRSHSHGISWALLRKKVIGNRVVVWNRAVCSFVFHCNCKANEVSVRKAYMCQIKATGTFWQNCNRVSQSRYQLCHWLSRPLLNSYWFDTTILPGTPKTTQKCYFYLSTEIMRNSSQQATYVETAGTMVLCSHSRFKRWLEPEHFGRRLHSEEEWPHGYFITLCPSRAYYV